MKECSVVRRNLCVILGFVFNSNDIKFCVDVFMKLCICWLYKHSQQCTAGVCAVSIPVYPVYCGWSISVEWSGSGRTHLLAKTREMVIDFRKKRTAPEHPRRGHRGGGGLQVPRRAQQQQTELEDQYEGCVQELKKHLESANLCQAASLSSYCDAHL